MATDHNSDRLRLRRILEEERARIVENPDDDAAEIADRLRLLNKAIEGLESLDFGERPPIFTPSKRRHWGVSPMRAHDLQLKALMSVVQLREASYSAAKARGLVAKHYGVNVEVIKQWRRRLETAGEVEGATLEEYEDEARMSWRSKARLGHPSDEASLLRTITQDGKAFQKARINKKPVKPEATKVPKKN